MTDQEAATRLKQAFLAARPNWRGKIWIRYSRRPDYVYNRLTVSVRGIGSITTYTRDEDWWDNQWNYTIEQTAAHLMQEIDEMGQPS